MQKAVDLFKNIIKSINKLSNKSKIIGIVALFLLSVGIIIPIISKSFALASEYKSYTLGSTAYSEGKGFRDGGYFYVHMAKNGTLWKSSKITVKPKSDGDKKDKSNAYYKWLRSGSRGYSLSSSNKSLITVDSSASSTKRSFNNNPQDEYEYINPAITLTIPKGYYVSSTSHAQPPIGTCSTGGTGRLLSTYAPGSKISNKSNKHLLEDKVGPYSSDHALKGYFGINIAETAVFTARHCNTGKYHRHWDSYNINIKPNVTTITFNANGGTGAPASQTKTYGQSLTLSSTTPTKSGITFNSWNTKADGTGTRYTAGQVLGAEALPSTTNLTLYAQYGSSLTCSPGFGGYTTINTNYGGVRGWNNGYFTVHLAKCSTSATTSNYKTTCTVYACAKISLSNSVSSCSTSANETCYKNIRSASRTHNLTSNNTNFVKIGASSVSYTTSLEGSTQSDGYYYYIQPSTQILIPKGYKAYTQIYGYDTTKYSGANLLYVFKTNNRTTANKANTLQASSDSGPYASDTWWSGYYGINLFSSAGVTTRGYTSGSTTYRYRTYQSNNILFKPNVTTIAYNANGGTGTMSNQSKAYDSELTLTNNSFTKEGYRFKGWNTQSDGTGTSFANLNKLEKDQWPTPASTPSGTSTVTLYAQWEQGEGGTFGSCAWKIDNGKLTIYPEGVDECTLGSSTSINDIPWYSSRTSVTSVMVEPGVNANANSRYLFYEISNATEMDVSNLNTSNVTDMEYMFRYCSSITNIIKTLIQVM